MIFLYDPIKNIKTKTNFIILSNLTKKSITTLRRYKKKKEKLTILNCYIIDEKATKEELYDYMCRETIENEVWRDIPNTNEMYQISNYGRVRVKNTDGTTELLFSYINKNNSLCVKIRSKTRLYNTLKEVPIHKLVATAFVKNTCNGVRIWHKNGDVYDNHANNLQWVDLKTFSNYMIKNSVNSRSIPVAKLDIKTEEVLEVYKNATDAAKKNKLSRQKIHDCIKGIRKTTGGYKWAIDKESLDFYNNNRTRTKEIPVIQIDTKTGKSLGKYTSITHAAATTGICRESIRLCIKGVCHLGGGCKWVIDEDALSLKNHKIISSL